MTTISKLKNVKSKIEDKYVKMTQLEHILALPDTYVGSIVGDLMEMDIFDSDTKKIVQKPIIYNGGLYKLFDELMVNARDQTCRTKLCKNINVTFDKTTHTISIYNDGNTIDVAIHPEHKIYVPELIFSNLLTSTNYNEKGKTVGGKNGYGAKLANIFSTKFEIDLNDTLAGLNYKQTFRSNMSIIEKPIISKIDKKAIPYFKVSFTPDLSKFGIDSISDDMYALFSKRVYDIAGCTKVAVKLNDEPIKISSFEQYIHLYYPTDKTPTIIHEIINDRWEVAVIFDPAAGFIHKAFSNGICNYKGGTHVNYISDQISKQIINKIKSKNKDFTTKATIVKEHLTIFINAVINDPGFDSQTKECLNTKVDNYGSECIITSTMIDALSKTGIIDAVINISKAKEMLSLTKTDGKKTAKLSGIAKLDDANLAGTKRSSECCLILTEGDSAKAFAISGLSVIGRDKYGVFPLKGKMLNVREASPKQIEDNIEIGYIKQILGLKTGMKYTETSKLRYGHIMIMADQDTDGSHIKGLVINFISVFWPSLLQIDGFIQYIKTPLLKVFKSSDTNNKNPLNTFYTVCDFEKWVKTDMKGNISNYKTKYYKGLATSTDKEAKEAFNDFENHIINYIWKENIKIDQDPDFINNINEEQDIDADVIINSDDVKKQTKIKKSKKTLYDSDAILDKQEVMSKANEALKLGFSKEFADKRKEWLGTYDKTDTIDIMGGNVTLHDFIHKDLKHFSNADNIRSLPSVRDSFKPSQRKVIFAAFKKGIDKHEIKVAQFAAYVSENTQYHHGEVSLQGTIIKLAQDFVGSNNINLLLPCGNFGYRNQGGADAGNARYIFTQLNPVTRKIYRKEDDAILTYQIDDGDVIEPECYAPIIPMILVNGSIGIGTGYSTFVPLFNPKTIIKNILNLMKGLDLIEMEPFYRGFLGKIVKIDHKKTKKEDLYRSYNSVGVYKIIDENTIRITEIPVSKTITGYREFLETKVFDEKKNNDSKIYFISSIKNDSSNFNIDITITLIPGTLQVMLKDESIDNIFQLTDVINTSNMHLYNDGIIKKFTTPEDILRFFYNVRLEYYTKRMTYQIKLYENELNIYKYKKLFIESINKDNDHKDKLVIYQRETDDIKQDLVDRSYPKLSNDINASDDKKSYSYLLDLTISAMSKSRLAELQKQIDEKDKDLSDYKKLTPIELWKNELTELSASHDAWLKTYDDDVVITKKTTVKGKLKKK